MPFISSPTLNFTTMVKKLDIESTYELSSSATQVDEGQQITFTLSTTNVSEGTLVPYSLGGDSGITVDDYEIISNTTLQNSTFDTDLSGWSLSAEGGQTNTSYVFYDSFNGAGTAKLYMKYAVHANMKSEITHSSLGNQTNVIRVNIPQADVESKMNVQFTVDDVVHSQIGFWTNIEDFPNMVSNGDGTYSGYIEHEYTYDINSNETYRVHIYADQKQYPGTSTPSIVYVDSVEVQSSENFVIDASGQASVTYLIKNDSAVEGTETLTLSLDNAEDDISVDLIDKTESYQLSSSATQVDEGQQVTFTLSTTGLAENTSVPYTIQDSSDITSQALTNPDFNTDMNDWTNTVGTHSAIVFDSKYGGSQKHYGRFNNSTSSRATLTHSTSGPQTIKVRVNIPEVSYNHNLAYVSVWKNQTEFLSPTSWVEIQSHPNMAETSTINHNGNANFWAGYIEIEYTEDVDLNDTYEVYFAFASTSYSTSQAYCYVDSVEITSNAGFVSVNDLEILDSQTSTFNSISDFSGNFTVDASGQSSVTYLIKDDSAIEGTETLTLSLDNGEDNISVDLIDNVPITYQLSSSATQVDEGGQVTITLSTTGLAENTSVPYTLQGSSDVTSQFLPNNQFFNQGDVNPWTVLTNFLILGLDMRVIQ